MRWKARSSGGARPTARERTGDPDPGARADRSGCRRLDGSLVNRAGWSAPIARLLHGWTPRSDHPLGLDGRRNLMNDVTSPSTAGNTGWPARRARRRTLFESRRGLESRIESLRAIRRDRRRAADRDGGADGGRRTAGRDFAHPHAQRNLRRCATSRGGGERGPLDADRGRHALTPPPTDIEKTTQVLNRTIGGGIAIVSGPALSWRSGPIVATLIAKLCRSSEPISPGPYRS